MKYNKNNIDKRYKLYYTRHYPYAVLTRTGDISLTVTVLYYRLKNHSIIKFVFNKESVVSKISTIDMDFQEFINYFMFNPTLKSFYDPPRQAYEEYYLYIGNDFVLKRR